jgi:hypothetical protein
MGFDSQTRPVFVSSLTHSDELLSSEAKPSFNNSNKKIMTRQELYTLLGRLLREYRAALLADFYNEQGAKLKIDESRNAVLCAVRKTKRFAYYSFSDLPWRAYEIVSKQESGEAEYIGALNRYLERCAETIRDEVRKIREVPWNAGTEMAKFRRLSEEYRKLFEANYLSRASIERELYSIRRRMIAIYAHPKMVEMAHLKFILLEVIARPTSYEESTNGLDAALSREAFMVLEKLQQAFKKLKERSKKPR